MTTNVEAKVHGLFATPVAILELADTAGRNADMARIILAKRSLGAALIASNLGGWHSERDIMAWGGPHVVEVLRLAVDMANRLTSDREGKPVAPDWKITAWANVNGPGNANTTHYHPGAFWSGTYYVDDGGCAENPALGGEFEMLDPRGVAPAMYAPGLAFAGIVGQTAGFAEVIRPKQGLLCLFPSWLMHQVRPYRGTGLRISLAFNLAL